MWSALHPLPTQERLELLQGVSVAQHVTSLGHTVFEYIQPFTGPHTVSHRPPGYVCGGMHAAALRNKKAVIGVRYELK